VAAPGISRVRPPCASWEFNSTLFPNPPEFFAWANGRHLYVDLALHGQIPVGDPQAAATLSIAGGSLAQAGCPTFGPSDTCYVFGWGNEAQAEAYFNLVQELSNDGAKFYWLDWCCEASEVSTPGVDPDGWIGQLSAQQMIDNGARGFVLSRVGASNLRPLAGRYPSGAWADHRSVVHFTGDAYATWSLISDEIERTTGEASIGEPYVSDDIGGFYAPPGNSNDPDDLYLRFLQMGVFQPIMRLHSSDLDRLPWQFDASTQAVGDAFLQLRESLVPYLQAAFLWSAPGVRRCSTSPCRSSWPPASAARRGRTSSLPCAPRTSGSAAGTRTRTRTRRMSGKPRSAIEMIADRGCLRLPYRERGTPNYSFGSAEHICWSTSATMACWVARLAVPPSPVASTTAACLPSGVMPSRVV
jgi:hypothetical protein